MNGAEWNGRNKLGVRCTRLNSGDSGTPQRGNPTEAESTRVVKKTGWSRIESVLYQIKMERTQVRWFVMQRVAEFESGRPWII
jgi:hypothetical protein